MANYDSNYAIAQEISARIGNAPIPFDSVYSIALQIYQELGGEESEFDSVYSILLGILPLAESVAKRTSITDIDELPEPKDNNNIYRLNSDDEVYVSKHVSTTYSDKAPDEYQIGVAVLKDDEDDVFVYRGAYKVICSDGEIDGYCWYYTDDEFDFPYITLDNAVEINENTVIYYIDSEEIYPMEIDDENKIINISSYSIESINNGYKSTTGEDYIPYSATYNAPEAGCIGNATLEDNQMGISAVYSGEEVEYLDEDTQEQCVGYKWNITDEDTQGYDYIVTSKKASEIYYTTIENVGIYSDTIVRAVVEGVGEYTDFKTLYIPQLNAPDSEQIGKAYLVCMDDGEETTRRYYNGVEMSIVLSDRTLTVYPWGDMSDLVGSCPFTIKPAYQIYSGNEYFYYGLDSFEWEISGNTLTCTDITYSEFNEECGDTLQDADFANHTVPYIHTIEKWEWKDILLDEYATNEEIDALFQ